MNPTTSPAQVRTFTGVARVPYMPSQAIQKAELELIRAAWLEGMCRSDSTFRPLLTTTPSTAAASRNSQSRRRRGSARARQRAKPMSRAAARRKRTPAASSGGRARAMMRFTA